MPQNSIQNPMFRKAILPWYDTDAACILMGSFMLIVCAFSVAGVAVALETPENRAHIWIPCTLLVSSVVVITTTLLRLIRRRSH